MAYKLSSGNRTLGDIIFEEDTDTGIDFDTNKVALEANGQERLIADADGIHALGSQRVSVTSPGSYPYTVVLTDYVIAVDTNSSRTINIPQAEAADVGRILIILDNEGQAGSNNITISPGADRNIAGSSTYVINSAGGVVTLLCTTGGHNGGWSVINKIT